MSVPQEKMLPPEWVVRSVVMLYCCPKRVMMQSVGLGREVGVGDGVLVSVAVGKVLGLSVGVAGGVVVVRVKGMVVVGVLGLEVGVRLVRGVGSEDVLRSGVAVGVGVSSPLSEIVCGWSWSGRRVLAILSPAAPLVTSEVLVIKTTMILGNSSSNMSWSITDARLRDD